MRINKQRSEAPEVSRRSAAQELGNGEMLEQLFDGMSSIMAANVMLHKVAMHQRPWGP